VIGLYKVTDFHSVVFIFNLGWTKGESKKIYFYNYQSYYQIIKIIGHWYLSDVLSSWSLRCQLKYRNMATTYPKVKGKLVICDVIRLITFNIIELENSCL